MTVAKHDARPFIGGVPTEPDVRLLKRTYAEALAVGLTIPFAEVADAISVSPDSARFATVTARWRREVEQETGFVIGAPGDKTFRVLSASETLTLSNRKARTAARATKRSMILSRRVDRAQLTDAERQLLNYTQKVNGKVLAAFQVQRKAELPALE